MWLRLLLWRLLLLLLLLLLEVKGGRLGVAYPGAS
jgi:hypothetical protein